MGLGRKQVEGTPGSQNPKNEPYGILGAGLGFWYDFILRKGFLLDPAVRGTPFRVELKEHNNLCGEKEVVRGGSTL